MIICSRNKELELDIAHVEYLTRNSYILFPGVAKKKAIINAKINENYGMLPEWCLVTKPFSVAERISDCLDHTCLLHFSDIQSCSRRIPFPASAIHSNHRTNETILAVSEHSWDEKTR